MSPKNQDEFKYDVALSFAGEDRTTVEKFAKLLAAKNISYFFDEAEADELWGKDLIAHLADVYENQARYCVMFISRYYPLKRWTNFERTHIQARAFRDTSEYILPIKLDDTEVPGIAETTGYRDIRQHSLDDIARSLEQKLVKAKGQSIESSVLQNTPSSQQELDYAPLGPIPMPKRKKSFTQLQKDRFARESFDFIKKYFQQALRQLEGHDQDIQTNFIEINNLEFACKIYVQETAKCQCAIWLGDSLMPNTIYYSEGAQRSGHSSFNDYLPVEDNGEELCLHIGSFGIGIVRVDEPLATQQQAAEYLWKRFTSNLEYR